MNGDLFICPSAVRVPGTSIIKLWKFHYFESDPFSDLVDLFHNTLWFILKSDWSCSQVHKTNSMICCSREDYQWVMTGVWVCSSHKPVVWLQKTCSEHVIWPIFMVLLQPVWSPQYSRGITAWGKRATSTIFKICTFVFRRRKIWVWNNMKRNNW